MSIADITNTINQARATYALRRINRQLPVLTIQTAPSQKTYWFEVQSVSYDLTSYDDQGQLGVIWCEGVQHYLNSQGIPATMPRTVPAYVLAAE